MKLLQKILIALCLVLLSPMAFAGDKEDIVGRWNHPWADSVYVRFRDDGTFKDVSLLGVKEGKYRIVENGVLEIDTPGLVYGRNVTEVKYAIKDGVLKIGEVEYKRFK